ncbi:MAG: DUF3450 family protein [Akkermansiaceae bacterium]
MPSSLHPTGPGFLKSGLAVLLSLILCTSAQEPDKEPPAIPTTKLVEQWLGTERLLSKEAGDWLAEKDHTNQLLELYRKELALLDKELAAAGKNAGLVDEEAETLKAKVQASETARRQAIAFLTKIKPRVTKLVGRFPVPLQDTVEQEAFSLKSEVTNENAAEILRSLIKILQDAARFNRSFTFDEEEITLNGESYAAKMMYFGLSRAYFLAGEKAGLAIPGEDGWTFQERNELAGELTRAFAIQAKETQSGFFTVPLKK